MTLLVGRQEGHPACKKLEWWGAGVVICLERGADLHMAQLMPLPLTVSCFSKIQIRCTFLVPAHLGSPGQRAVKLACVCVATTYSRCRGIVNNHIKKGLLLSLPVKFFFENQSIFGKVTSKKVTARAFCVPNHQTANSQRKCTTQSTFLPRNYAKYSPILKLFSLADSAINLS